MIQIRIHGRGGQGVVTAAELIAIAAFFDNRQSQAFPSFGVERTGAPIEVIENLQEIEEEEEETYESILEIWPDYPTEEDYLWNEDEY